MRMAAETLAPAFEPFCFAAVGPAARTDGAADVLPRAVEPGLGAPFDLEAKGETDADFVDVTEACVVGCALDECRGVDEGVLEGAG
jgi:hypothetical protein